MQTARGASLSSQDIQQSPASRKVLLAYFVAVVALGIDAVTKVLAVHRLGDRGPVHVVGDLLQFELARNPGAAFSTGTSYTPVISVAALVAAVVVAWYIRRVRSIGWAWAFGLLLAGIVGNLGDRIFREPGPFRGHVVDFLALPHWPIFNIADVCINIAAVLILIQALRGIHLDGSRDQR